MGSLEVGKQLGRGCMGPRRIPALLLCLLCARNCLTCFMYTNIFNPHNNPMDRYYFAHEEAQA